MPPIPPPNLDIVMAALPLYTPDQRAALLNRLLVLQDYGGPPSLTSTTSIPDEELLYQALSKILIHDRLKPPPYSVFRKTQIYSTFHRQLDMITPFLDEFQSSERRDKVALYNIAAGLLRENIVDRGIARSLKTYVMHLHCLPQLFDEAFPTYLENGWLPFIIQALHHTKQAEWNLRAD